MVFRMKNDENEWRNLSKVLGYDVEFIKELYSGDLFEAKLRTEINEKMLPQTNYIDSDVLTNKDNVLTKETEDMAGIKEIEVNNRRITYGNGLYEVRRYGKPYKKRVNILKHRRKFEDSDRDIFEENRRFGRIDDEEDITDMDKKPTPEKKSKRYKDLTKEEKRFRNDKRSLNRSRDKIRELVLCNDFSEFWTLTFSPDKVNDRYDDDEVIQKFRDWMKNIRKRKCKFDYIAIPERHEDGAIHFHLLTSGHELTLVDSTKTLKDGRKIYNLSDWRFGFSTVIEVDDQKERLANYVTKYITKQFNDDNAVNPRYIPSRGLKEATIEHNVSTEGLKPTFTKIDEETGEILYQVLREPEQIPDID